ncbi:MAG: hypothetical protein JNM80_08920 [Phycisphaerae bacterium]|nr:hypothetical protein [Phycisphaerae bacterium]
MNQLDEYFHALPYPAHILAAVGLVAGLLLWFRGRQILKPLFCILGGLGGATLGFSFVPALGLNEIAGIPSPYLGLGIGTALGLIAGLLLFRFAMAIWLAVGLGAAAVLGASAGVQYSPIADWRGARDQLVAPLPPTESPASNDARSIAMAKIKPVAGRVREFVSSHAQEAKASFDALPAQSRLILLGAGLGASLAGFAVGLAWPKRVAAAGTALAGSGIALVSAVWLARAFGLPGWDSLGRNPMILLIAWLALGAVGFMAQIKAGKRLAPAAESE